MLIKPGIIAGGGDVVPYKGQVATRTLVPNNYSTSVQSIMAQRWHYARDNITSLQLVIPNFAVGTSNSYVETTNAGTSTITASIVYNGTIQQVLFSASPSVSTAVPLVISDALSTSIPVGAQFYVRIFITNPTGLGYSNWSQGTASNPGISTGDNYNFGATPSAISDQTLSPSVTNAVGWTGTTHFGAAAIIANTTKPSVFLLGDSRCFGAADIYDSSGDLGELARSIGPKFAYINAGIEGDSTVHWLANNTNRLALAQYTSHGVVQLGVNDIANGVSITNLFINRTAIRGLLGARTVFETTIPVQTGTTDNWTTTTNQTGINNIGSVESFNANVRARMDGMAGYFDIQSVVDTVGNVWNADGVTPHLWTPDGTHETQFANLAIQSALGASIQAAIIPGPTASAPWVPNYLGGLLGAWFDASNTTNITLVSGNQVSSWKDKISGITATQATSAAQPTWSATARNGTPGISFNSAATQNLSLASIVAFPVLAYTSTIAIAMYAPNATGGDVLSYGGTGGNLSRNLGATGGDVYASNTSVNHLTTFPLNGNDAFAEWVIGSGVDSITVDGGTPSTGSLATPATTVVAGNIGVFINGSSVPFNGTIQQIFVINGVLTTSQRQKLEGWESWHDGKAGSNLPSNHPYKSRPPLVGDL